MKTPEEIKKGLECCSDMNADCEGVCPYFMVEGCLKQCKDDAIAYIQQLESRLAQTERERDALMFDMHQLQGALCAYCKNHYRSEAVGKMACRVFGENYGASDDSPLICGCFKWRGVCPENTKEETDG